MSGETSRALFMPWWRPGMKSELDTYLARLRFELRKLGLLDDRIIEEARGHLTDATERGKQRGLTLDAAEREAIAQFGSPELVAWNFAVEKCRVPNRLLQAAAVIIGTVIRRGLRTVSGDGQSGYHDRQAGFHFGLRTKRGWVDPELLAIASDPDTRLVPFLQRVAPRPLGPLGKIESLTLVEESKNLRTYRAVFRNEAKIICTVALAPDGRAVSVDWSRSTDTSISS